MAHEILIYNKSGGRIPKKFIHAVVSGALNFLKPKQPIELAVLVVGRAEIKRLNKTWRKKNEAPDELSFGLNSRQIDTVAKSGKGVLGLGEIVLNSACLSAGREKIFNRKYLTKILVHSLLHLLGHDHEKSIARAQKMERLETKILKYLII